MTKQEILERFKDIDFMYNDSSRLDTLSRMIDELLQSQPQIVRCKDCKHRPKKPNWETYESGFDIEFPEGSKCPCHCSGDEWYSWYPEDDWFCADGEKDGDGDA